MQTAVLSGEVGSVSWKLNFQYDVRTYECRMTCKRNGADDSALLDLLLTAFVDVLKKRFPPEELPLENSNVGEGLTGEFLLSSKDDGELTEAELASCQASIRDAFAEFLEAHPDDTAFITDQARMSARVMNAARKARAAMSKREYPFDFPELPKRIRWATPAPDIRQMRLNLLATLQSDDSEKEMRVSCQRLQNELQRSKDARVMEYFKSDFERVQELLDEKLGLNGLARRMTLPESTVLRLGVLPSRYAAWRLELEFFSLHHANAALLSARIGEIPGLKRRGDNLWRLSLGPIGDLATFRKVAWPTYVKVYNQLRAICLEIFHPNPPCVGMG